jgi:hypothetical protein
MTCTASSNGEHLFECPTCGRKAVIGGTAGYAVLQRGDLDATHYGVNGSVTLTAHVDIPTPPQG